MRKLFLCFPLLLLIVISCQTPESQIDQQADVDQIMANIKAFSEFCMAGDVEGIVNSYTEDGKIFPNGSDILSGPDALRQYWTPRPGGGITYHKITPVGIEVNGDTAYDHGYYEGRSLQADSTEASWQGKYVIVWKKVEGAWKMDLDIWNSVNTPRE